MSAPPERHTFFFGLYERTHVPTDTLPDNILDLHNSRAFEKIREFRDCGYDFILKTTDQSYVLHQLRPKLFLREKPITERIKREAFSFYSYVLQKLRQKLLLVFLPVVAIDSCCQSRDRVLLRENGGLVRRRRDLVRRRRFSFWRRLGRGSGERLLGGPCRSRGRGFRGAFHHARQGFFPRVLQDLLQWPAIDVPLEDELGEITETCLNIRFFLPLFKGKKMLCVYGFTSVRLVH